MTVHSTHPAHSPAVTRRLREYLEGEEPHTAPKPAFQNCADDRRLWLSVLGVLVCLTLLLAMVVL